MRRLRIKPRGFSLLEVLIASAILPIGLVGALYMLGNSTLISREADLSMQAAEYGLQLTQEYEALGYTGLTPVPAAGSPGAAGTPVTFTNPVEPAITAGVTIVDLVATASVTVTATVNWNDKHGKAQVRTFSTVVSLPPAP